MTFEPINGREMELQGFQHSIHRPDFSTSKEELVEESIDSIRKKLKDVFDSEHGNKVIRVFSRDNKSTFFISAGFEENMYNEVMDFVRKVADTEAFPIQLRFHNFLSFSPLRDVNSDTDA